MKSLIPPTLPRIERSRWDRCGKLFKTIAIGNTIVVGTLFVLAAFGYIRPFNVPNKSMAPAISAGSHVVMEGLTFLVRKPRRGDIVVFRTDGIGELPEATVYVKRVAGEPGDRLRIKEGKIYINDKPVTLSNKDGEIAYWLSPTMAASLPPTDLVVPAGRYFVLGDNSMNSFDSRFWGSVPQNNILGRISFCYWPPEKVGLVK